MASSGSEFEVEVEVEGSWDDDGKRDDDPCYMAIVSPAAQSTPKKNVRHAARK